MIRPDRVDRFCYTKSEEIVIYTMQCEECIHKLSDPLKCAVYEDRKPTHVLKCEADCPDFKSSK